LCTLEHTNSTSQADVELACPTSHVSLYEANRSMVYRPFESSNDPQASYITSPASSGSTTVENVGMSIDADAALGVSIPCTREHS
jgi:hypothetical protein